jgi:cephalosporin-C deacetylase-like acetyl esterase
MVMMGRRTFIRAGAVLAASGLAWGEREAAMDDLQAFKAHQQARRGELWNLLGRLPEARKPTASLLRREQRQGYALEHLVLDLNGVQPVPALMLLPDNLKTPAPGMLYIHWHGGDYNVGKNELFEGTRAMEAYAPVYAEKGIAALAIDSWCFGERAPYPDEGKRGEEDTFKEMLWKGRCLFGMMLFDERQALDYLCARPEVDPGRIGAFGISMGATKAWWLAALDERIRCCIDLCCLTDFQSLIEYQGLHRHGIYYYVPSLLNHFQTADINELIVPRPRLSLNGREDGLTPPRGVEKVRDHLLPLYERYGKKSDCRIELFDCPHKELPEMRALVLEWLDRYL